MQFFCNINFINYLSAHNCPNNTVQQIGFSNWPTFEQIVLYSSDNTVIQTENDYLLHTGTLILWRTVL